MYKNFYDELSLSSLQKGTHQLKKLGYAEYLRVKTEDNKVFFNKPIFLFLSFLFSPQKNQFVGKKSVRVCLCTYRREMIFGFSWSSYVV